MIRKHAVQFLLLVVVPLSTLLFVQCGGFNIFPIEQDVQLGADLDQQIRANSKEYPVLADTYVRDYVQNMVNEIKRAPSVKYANKFPYKVEIINDGKTLNAFCTPGGYIYVYTGIIKALDNEASLAAVLGHEIAHAEHRHSTNRMTKQYGASVLLEIALGKNPGRTSEMAAQLFTGLALLKNSRDDEAESDVSSFEYLKATRWYPGSLAYFFEKVKGNSSGGSIERLLSTHPLPQDRIDANNDRVRKANLNPPTENNLLARPYQDLKKRLP